jgi:tetratricopeptide (TPR) repeat protein
MILRKYVIAVVLIMIGTVLTACSSRVEEALNDEGYSLYLEGLYDEAITHYTQSLVDYPEYGAFYSNRGMAYYEKGDVALALEDLDQAIVLEPKMPEAYLNRGTVYLGSGVYDQASKDFYKAIQLKDNFKDENGLYYTYLNLGTLLNENSQPQEALVILEKAFELNNNDEKLYNALGQIYKSIGDYDLALSYFNGAIELKEDYAYAYGNRGSVYYLMEEYRIALSDVNTALSMDPYIPQMYDLKAKILIKTGELEEAIRILDAGITRWVNYADLYITRGNIYFGEKAYGEALMNYGLGIEYGSLEGYKGQGVTYQIIGQYEDAIIQLKTYLQTYPADISTLITLGMVYRQTKDYEMSLTQYDKVLSLSAHHTEAMYQKALTYVDMQAMSEAEKILNQLLSIDPDHKASKEALVNMGVKQ